MTLDIANQQLIEGLTVFGDSDAFDTFYVMPDQPHFRVDTLTKKPVFKFIKYKLPVDRPDGRKGGGFVVFDTEFKIPAATLKKISDTLQTQVTAAVDRMNAWRSAQIPPWALLPNNTPPNVRAIPFTAASATLTLLDTSGILVTKINSPGHPSVFGSMLCPFTAELTPEGATVLEAAMSGSGGVAQVTYDVHFPATFPPLHASIYMDATKTYHFEQTIEREYPHWYSLNRADHNNTITERFHQENNGYVNIDMKDLGFIPDPDVQKKVHDSITSWAWSQVDAAAKSLVLPDIKASEALDPNSGSGTTSETVTRDVKEDGSFYRSLTEREGITFEDWRGGTMPSIADMGFTWKDYVVEVDANDPFFSQISATFTINADFEKYGIKTVNVNAQYTKTAAPTMGGFTFTKPDDYWKFDSDTAHGDMSFTYSYQVNYLDANQAYQSPVITTTNSAITINANDLGVLYLKLSIGNVDFAKTPQVQVSVTYPDTDASGSPISHQFNFDATKKSDTLLSVILKPVDQPYTYQVTYILADGSQMVMAAVKSNSSEVFINSPFILHTFSFLAEGDFANGIDNIFLKMAYTDSVNKVSQSTDFDFTAAARQKDWTIPVVANAAGVITYSGVVSYKNHTTESIPETTTTKDLIEFGPPNQVIISVTPDPTLLDFTKVRLVKVDLAYADPAHQIDMKQEIVLRPGGAPTSWTFYARDPAKLAYTWSAEFFMATTPPTVVKVAPSSSTDSVLILMMPS